jgi:hypothetical protein
MIFGFRVNPYQSLPTTDSLKKESKISLSFAGRFGDFSTLSPHLVTCRNVGAASFASDAYA